MQRSGVSAAATCSRGALISGEEAVGGGGQGPAALRGARVPRCRPSSAGLRSEGPEDTRPCCGCVSSLPKVTTRGERAQVDVRDPPK